MNSPTTTRRPSRRVLAAVAAVLLLIGALIAVLVLTGGEDAEPSASSPSPGATASASAGGSSAPISQPAPTNPPTPEPTGPTSDATELPPTVAPVGLTDESEVGDGVSGRLLSIEAVQGDGEGVGNVDGPSLRITVELTNGTDAPVSFDAVAVEAYTGSDLTPATLLDDASSSPLQGTAAPGETRTGSYVFYVPEDDRDDVTVQVGYQAGAPYLAFQGAVS